MNKNVLDVGDVLSSVHRVRLPEKRKNPTKLTSKNALNVEFAGKIVSLKQLRLHDIQLVT